MTRQPGQMDGGRRMILQWGLASTAAMVLGAASRVLPGEEPEGERAATEDVKARLVGGRWQGLLAEDGLPVPVALRFERDAAGQLTGVFEARDWGLLGLPLQELALEQDQLRGRIDIMQARLTIRVHRDHLEAEIAGREDTGGDYVHAIRLLRDHPAVRPYLVPRLNAGGARETSYTYAPPQNLGDGWPVGHLEDVSMAPHLIEPAVIAILDGRYPWIESLLVVRRGTLVLDEYFYGRAPQMRHYLMSATKSVTSLLVGIAIDRGDIRGVDVPVHSFFGDYAGRRWVAERYDITLRQALAMSAGLEWNEWAFPYTDPRNPAVAMNLSGDWIAYVLDRPSRPQEPGRFEYITGLSMLLGGVLHRATGRRVDAFAREHLFGPLGIHHFTWGCRSDGTCHTGGGLWLRPRDLAKLGQLVLNGGTWGGKRVVSEAWIRESTAIHSRTEQIAYGYQWWLPGATPSAGVPLVMAWGHGGQFLLIMPRHDLVVVSTAKDYENTVGALRMLGEHILPAAGAQPKGE